LFTQLKEETRRKGETLNNETILERDHRKVGRSQDGGENPQRTDDALENHTSQGEGRTAGTIGRKTLKLNGKGTKLDSARRIYCLNFELEQFEAKLVKAKAQQQADIRSISEYIPS
jgi:hypothetical protein